ncbi:hypothetical protein SJAG_03105 [Schizosaccharomyces japonicus yFS275]|uniref:Uncharacterized protein n=1 Tax=Schizosaccharomyces japonicus (strain yFS275 / FY16936) TaxID=402676 RepID=B6K3C1_SCHJY|nr:hypothetical protein SJAG_03105 [Schizosaccharomyces japonicus yFS275]EEB07978.1 hypothetical protein SJAG_03105 [Schizosaccharomyces japonicus yFS275]
MTVPDLQCETNEIPSYMNVMQQKHKLALEAHQRFSVSKLYPGKRSPVKMNPSAKSWVPTVPAVGATVTQPPPKVKPTAVPHVSHRDKTIRASMPYVPSSYAPYQQSKANQPYGHHSGKYARNNNTYSAAPQTHFQNRKPAFYAPYYRA